jgi:radical SAM superfamily enzyme YgiQ (UPF0313 family)
LINPPRENEIIANNPVIIEEERGYNPPLGLLYVAADLEQNSGHEVTVIDAQVEELTYEQLEQRVRDESPDVAGLTAMSLTLIDVIKCVQLIKGIDPEITVVLGGPHVHLFPDETIDLEGVDYLVLGEGEYTFIELLDNLGDPGRLENIPGLVFKRGAGTINTGIRTLIEDLDAVPHPARHMVPYEKYSSLLAIRNPATTVFTSRGCPFKCTFCDRPNLGKRFRARSAGNVVEELEICREMGIYDYLFYDDTFTVDRKRVVEVCRLIVEKKLDISFDIRARVDTVDAESLEWLKKAGCRGIHYGVEAGTEKILKVLNKHITIDKVREVFDMTRAARIPILAYFMLGNPTETMEDIEETLRVMKMLKPDYIHMTVFTPFPGTKIYLDGLESGAIERDYWREFARNPTSDFTPPYWDENFTREELFDILSRGYRSFYLTPLYILKKLFRIRTFTEFKKKFSAGMKVFSMKRSS